MKKKVFSLFSVLTLLVLLAVPQAVSAIDQKAVKLALKNMNDQLAADGQNIRIDGGAVSYV